MPLALNRNYLVYRSMVYSHIIFLNNKKKKLKLCLNIYFGPNLNLKYLLKKLLIYFLKFFIQYEILMKSLNNCQPLTIKKSGKVGVTLVCFYKKIKLGFSLIFCIFFCAFENYWDFFYI